PELDAAISCRVRLETGAVDGQHETAVGNRMCALCSLPRHVLAFTDARLLLRMPADGGRVDQDLGTLERRQPRCLRVPLVPADEYAQPGGIGGKHLEAQVARREIVFFVVAR